MFFGRRECSHGFVARPHSVFVYDSTCWTKFGFENSHLSKFDSAPRNTTPILSIEELHNGAALDHLTILPSARSETYSDAYSERPFELKTTMKFLLAFGLLQATLALRMLDESQTVPENVQIQGKEVGYRRTIITTCCF